MTFESKTARMAMVVRNMSGTPTSPLAQRALALVDAEHLSSAPGIVGLYHRDAAAFRGNRELSEEGKSARVRAAADSRLGGVARVARDFAEIEKEHKAKQAAVLARAAPPAADSSQTLIDLALAAQVLARAPVLTFKLEGASERVRQALVRTPIELSGITPEQHARLIGTFVSPEAAAELGEEADALANGRTVVQAAINELQAVAQLDAKALVKSFGTDWQLPGVLDGLMHRPHAQQAAELDAGEPASV